MDCKKSAEELESILKTQTNWKKLWFYQKTVVLYQMTYIFTKRFLPKYGDRTVDQMIQAARSGKQNIVEGSADGVTSTELELKLLNVARASIQELLEDYEDYLISHKLTKWINTHPRFDGMLLFCRSHNLLCEYEPYFDKWTDEEYCNIGISLCRMVDKMLMTYQKKKEKEFIHYGGIKERMTSARLKYRTNQTLTLETADKNLAVLQRENTELRIIIANLQKEIAQLKNK